MDWGKEGLSEKWKSVKSIIGDGVRIYYLLKYNDFQHKTTFIRKYGIMKGMGIQGLGGMERKVRAAKRMKPGLK